jgi:hypothetical protein
VRKDGAAGDSRSGCRASRAGHDPDPDLRPVPIRILLYSRIAMGAAIVSFDLANPLNEQYNSSDLKG